VGGGVHCGKVKENSFGKILPATPAGASDFNIYSFGWTNTALIPFHHEEHIFQRYRVLVHDMF
jgi:hypothetical protein